MNYPLISEYVQSVRLSEDYFDSLWHLRPVLDEDGNPVMSNGNYAVVFKMQDTRSGKFHAVKCFLRDQPGRDESYRLISSELEYVSSSFLTPVRYMDKELFVDTTQGGETEFPILLMDWVEGMTLDRYIRSNIHDTYKLSLAAYQFCRMGAWLLAQEFAHGDLKPDNIIMVGEGGQPVLIDYDGMFVPAMRGRKACEVGNIDYRHPLRTEDVFDAGIDDFSIASIALSLKAISLKPELLGEFGADDRLLFSAADYRHIGGSECLKAVAALADDRELSQLLGLFHLAYARNGLDSMSSKLIKIKRPEPPVIFSTKSTKKDRSDAIKDERGVKYSRDESKLLEVPKNMERCEIKEGVRIICDRALEECRSLREVAIPDSVTSIGNWAFGGCSSLREVVIPASVTGIGDGAFYGCEVLHVISRNSMFGVVDDCMLVDNANHRLISCCNSKEKEYVAIPASVTSIGDNAFFGCSSLREVAIPASVTSIGKDAFRRCSSLREIAIPGLVTGIGDGAFSGCWSLREVVIPASVTSIGNLAFQYCSSLQEVFIPASVTIIGNSAFKGCESLVSIIVPKGQAQRFRELLKYAGCGLSKIKEQDE